MKKNLEGRLQKLERRAGPDLGQGQEVAVIERDESGRVLSGAEYLEGGAKFKPGLFYINLTFVDTRKDSKP